MWDLYTHYVRERWQVYLRRSMGLPAPWTDDPVIAGTKFTNDFRILDAGTQFLVGSLCAEPVPLPELMMRCFLYRYTNRPEPWEYAREQWGRYPLIEDLESGALMELWRAAPVPVSGNAYQMYVGGQNSGISRTDWCVGLAAQAFTPDGGAIVIPAHKWSRTGEHYILPRLLDVWGDAEALFRTLTTVPQCATFMGQQILTDFTYLPGSTMSDSDWVEPGPGSRRGMDLVWPGSKEPHAVRLRAAHEYWQTSIRAPRLSSGHVQDRPLSLMDVQNTFCEFQKYVRRLESGKTFTPYRPKNPDETWAEPFLPAHW